jgi:flagellar protein FliO/FliZ
MKSIKQQMPTKFIFVLFFLADSSFAHAQNNVGQNSSADLLQIALGLLIVLTVIIAMAWIVKKMTSFHTGGMSVARIVGAVSVGTRERVVVLEIANRWIVVGVSSGNISAIANLDIEAIDHANEDAYPSKTGQNFLKTLVSQLNLNQQSNRNKDE